MYLDNENEVNEISTIIFFKAIIAEHMHDNMEYEEKYLS